MIAARKILPGSITESTVRHQPKEVSGVTRFILLCGATVTFKVLDIRHRRLPLVHGGLEIPVQVTVKLDYNPQNKAAIVKYDALVQQLYKESVDGKFDDIAKTVLKDMAENTDSDLVDDDVTI